ncbi:MAG: hypothetical protein V3T72_09880 [Thermoanaerobaculia bacterium]
MIILDEQLLGRGIETEIARWYPGSVQFIVDLRPGTVIKDDAIPALLRQESSATFVTINVRDFWLKVEADKKYCLVCFSLNDSRVLEIPERLRFLFSHPAFGTKAERMGKVVRMSVESNSFYSVGEKAARAF